MLYYESVLISKTLHLTNCFDSHACNTVANVNMVQRFADLSVDLNGMLTSRY